MIDGWGSSCEIVLRWMLLDLIEDKSTLVQVITWSPQATSHYLSQCWSRSMSPYGITRPQWVKARTRILHVKFYYQITIQYWKTPQKRLVWTINCFISCYVNMCPTPHYIIIPRPETDFTRLFGRCNNIWQSQYIIPHKVDNLSLSPFYRSFPVSLSFCVSRPLHLCIHICFVDFNHFTHFVILLFIIFICLLLCLK